MAFIAERLIPSVKLSAGITHDYKNEEIAELIEECFADLKLVGINKIGHDDPVIRSAVKNFCNFRLGIGENPADFKEAYDNLKATLTMSEEYTKESTGESSE